MPKSTSPSPDIYAGLMSGTSLDGVDGVLADFSGATPRVLAHASLAFPTQLRDEMLALNTPSANELHRSALAANALARLYASVVHQLLASSAIGSEQVRAIGAHGQTVRHQPQTHDGTGYTIQLNNPALLAELTGIDVVADLRSRDVAAGGQGAPLAPFFHQGLFARAQQRIGILNLGGIANLTLLDGARIAAGFDCGPANALMDAWCLQHTGNPYDDAGRWAAGGRVNSALLDKLLSDPYFALVPPKSTGRDLFNMPWLEAQLAPFKSLPAADVQASLAELTARTCAQAASSDGTLVAQLVVCGGGALNAHLMQRLAALLPNTRVVSSEACGMPPMQVEAAAFAWLARQHVNRQPLDLPKTTGARGARVLGALYPA